MSTQNFLRIPKIVLRKPCDEPKHAKTSTLVFFVYLKHRKYPPSDHPRTSSDPGYSGGIRSYGALFFTKRSTKPELISKMEFPIDLGFSLVDRYIVTALGKIKKTISKCVKKNLKILVFFFRDGICWNPYPTYLESVTSI